MVEEVPICGPEIKRPSANEVNGARGGSPVQSGMILDILDVRASAGGVAPTRDRAETKRRTPANYPATRSQCKRPFDRVDRCTRARYPRDT